MKEFYTSAEIVNAGNLTNRQLRYWTDQHVLQQQPACPGIFSRYKPGEAMKALVLGELQRKGLRSEPLQYGWLQLVSKLRGISLLPLYKPAFPDLAREYYLLTDGERCLLFSSKQQVIERMKTLEVGVRLVDVAALWARLPQ